MPYKTYCGGVIAMRRDIMHKINGFTNVMFGWGGEDDDIYARFVPISTITQAYNLINVSNHYSLYSSLFGSLSLQNHTCFLHLKLLQKRTPRGVPQKCVPSQN